MSHNCIAVQVFTQMNVSLTYNYMNSIAFCKHYNKLKNIHNNAKKTKTVQLYYTISMRTNCYTFFVIICLTFLMLKCFYIQFLPRVCCIFWNSSYCAWEDLFNLWTNKFSYIKIIILLSIIINVKNKLTYMCTAKIKKYLALYIYFEQCLITSGILL